jgi:hypothetical protein
MVPNFLQRTCLKPNHSLRRQLFVSFGASAVLTLCVVVILAGIGANQAGQTVKFRADQVTRAQVVRTTFASSRSLAEQLTNNHHNLEGTVQLMVEIARDRIVGYPNDGWLEDKYVPFRDQETNTNRYPLKATPVPLDWDVYPNIVPENAEEHLQERAKWLGNWPTTTASASFTFQGVCDPTAATANPNVTRNFYGYLENCTDANNNITTGGVYQPTLTLEGLHAKSAELSVFMKPLYESTPETFISGYYFFNDGAGATLSFPGYARNAVEPPYESVGCDWMAATNPHTNRSYGTAEQMSRCHPNGTLVPQRLYNPMERPWFRDMALQPDKILSIGPFKAFGSGMELIHMGRGMFDRRYVPSALPF